MALTAYLRLKGSQQGEIRGSVLTKGREGRMAVLESSHELTVPVDGVSGLAAGRAEHRPFVVVKEIDQATPALYRALVERELLVEAELQYWALKSKTAGTEVIRYAVQLRNARLMGMRFVQPDVLDADLRAFPEAEELSFTYERIEWRWMNPEASFAADAMQPGRRAAGAPLRSRARPARG